jgi:hypothetical protein
MTKICSACHCELSLTAFQKHAGHRDGLASQCKDCKNAKARLDNQAKNAGTFVTRRMARLGPEGSGKFCPDCQCVKPLEAFSHHRARPDGLQAYCRDCQQGQVQQRPRSVGLRYSRHYRLQHRELLNQRECERRAANREAFLAYWRAWSKAHPEQGRINYAKRRARKVGLPDTMTRNEVAYCFQYWEFSCAICGQQEGLFGLTLVLDHWVPLSSQACPGTVATNMLLMCHGRGGCNNSKLGKDPVLWLTRRYGARKAKAILTKITAYFALVAGTP